MSLGRQVRPLRDTPGDTRLGLDRVVFARALTNAVQLPRNARGFTLVELLVASAIGIVGLYASLTMAMYALHANQERRDAIAAEQLAEHLLSTIQAEAVLWTDKRTDTNGYYVAEPFTSGDGNQTAWLIMHGTAELADKRVGRMGNDPVWDPGITREIKEELATRYCAFWRLTYVTDSLLRAEAKVAWTRPHVAVDRYKDCPLTMTDDVGNVGTITLPAMVMKNQYTK